MDNEPFDTFNQILWTFQPDHTLTSQSKAFLEIIRHSLCSFHLVCRTLPEFVQNHERTHFIENVIPSLLALAKITRFFKFKRKKKEIERKVTFALMFFIGMKMHSYPQAA